MSATSAAGTSGAVRWTVLRATAVALLISLAPTPGMAQSACRPTRACPTDHACVAGVCRRWSYAPRVHQEQETRGRTSLWTWRVTPPYDASGPAWYREQRDARRARRTRNNTRAGLTIVGVGLFVGAYGINVLAGAFAGSGLSGVSAPTEWSDLRRAGAVPLVGPWAQLALRPESAHGWIAPLIVNGLVQAATLSVVLVALLAL